MTTQTRLEDVLAGIASRDPHQPEFHQAAGEVLVDVLPLLDEHPEMREAGLLERILEPDRILRFRVTWEDDKGVVHVNRGWRVQHSSALGPYKGGLRFHPSVNEGVLKFLALEQTFKNALTGLPLGAAKGGSDFTSKGRSEREVMRFCQSFMQSLWRHVGPDVDVPAGDIGVGGREIGYLFGQYRRLDGGWPGGVLTGKSLAVGGIQMRTEATGYGCVLFAEHMAQHMDRSVSGARAAVSGSGNVSLHAAEKLVSLGASVITLSDSGGTLRFPDGLTSEQLDLVKHAKLVERRRLESIAGEMESVQFEAGAKPWNEACDIVFPCATQNELAEADARRLVEAGAWLVAEGANMPCTPEATDVFKHAGVAHAPGKAANAGGVAMSGLEMAQNAQRYPWTRLRASDELAAIMGRIHGECAEQGRDEDGGIDYARGANRAGFMRVAYGLLSQGLV